MGLLKLLAAEAGLTVINYFSESIITASMHHLKVTYCIKTVKLYIYHIDSHANIGHHADVKSDIKKFPERAILTKK